MGDLNRSPSAEGSAANRREGRTDTLRGRKTHLLIPTAQRVGQTERTMG
jgi:hypothetical protein